MLYPERHSDNGDKANQCRAYVTDGKPPSREHKPQNNANRAHEIPLLIQYSGSADESFSPGMVNAALQPTSVPARARMSGIRVLGSLCS
jgi:hypothetical protein